MTTILVDHNMEGDATLLWGTIAGDGWLEIVPMRLATFADVNLPVDSNDRVVWRFAQEHRMLLLTDNRNMKGDDSLEQTIREEITADSLPVITIGSLDRIDESEYRQLCANRLVEIVVDLDCYLGYSRLFIP
ncbi:MAG: ACP S-malonyltransferase [Blastocatellia bacterium]